MNILLECYTKGSKGAIILLKDGKVCFEDVFVIRGTDGSLKKDMLHTIYKGLKVSRDFISHDDLLMVCVQNSTLVQWLSKLEEKKDYIDELALVYDVLDSLDCKVMFSDKLGKRVKSLLSTGVKEEVLEGLSLFDNL